MPIVYNPITDFLTKDTLPKEDPDKVILGADFSAEFDAISTAFLGAVTSLDPAFTGTITFEDATGDNLTLSTDLTVGGSATVGGTFDVTGNTTVGGTLDVTSNTTVGGTLGVTGNTTVGGTFSSGNATVGTLTSGAQTVTGSITASGTITSAGAELQTEADVLALIATAELGPVATLDDLSNVAEAGKTDGDYLVWDETAGNWEPSVLDLANISGDVGASGNVSGVNGTFTSKVTGASFFEGFSTITPVNGTLYFDWDNLADSGNRIDPSANGAGDQYGNSIYISPNGTVLWVHDHNNAPGDAIYQYIMSTPFDLSTATYDTALGTTAAFGIQNINFGTDGTTLIGMALGSTTIGIRKIVLNTAWDIGGGYTGGWGAGSVVNTQNYGYGYLKDDGTKYWTINGSVITEWVFATPYLHYTMSNSGRTFSTGGPSINHMEFNNDGSKMFLLINASELTEYNLSTNYDVTTATASGNSATLPYNSTLFGMDRAGSTAYALDSSSNIGQLNFSSTNGTISLNCQNATTFEVTLTANGTINMTNVPASGTAYAATVKVIQDGAGSGFTLAWPTGTVWATGTAPTLSTGASAEDVFVLLTHDGGTTWYGFTSGQAFA